MTVGKIHLAVRCPTTTSTKTLTRPDSTNCHEPRCVSMCVYVCAIHRTLHLCSRFRENWNFSICLVTSGRFFFASAQPLPGPLLCPFAPLAPPSVSQRRRFSLLFLSYATFFRVAFDSGELCRLLLFLTSLFCFSVCTPLPRLYIFFLLITVICVLVVCRVEDNKKESPTIEFESGESCPRGLSRCTRARV